MERHGACQVTLDQKLSNFANCTLGDTFGCDGPRMMWASRGCRGLFRCGPAQRRIGCDGPWDSRRNCSCVACDAPPAVPASADEHAMEGVNCCADNGATLSHGSWSTAGPSDADRRSCGLACMGSPGCTHYSYSHAPIECADDIHTQSRGFGRCVLCGACTRRARPTAEWQKSYVSYALSPPPREVAPAGGGVSSLIPEWLRGRTGAPASPTQASSPLPALILSGCDRRYERAAAIARSASLAPSWLVGVFRNNIASAPRCTWPGAAERNLLAAHRNAWSIVAAANVSMLVLEDDVELASTAEALHADVQRCEASAQRGGCELLLVGFVDAYWATHALYVTPRGARRLLHLSRPRWGCGEPTDYYTHRMCSTAVEGCAFGGNCVKDRQASWYRNHAALSPRCLAASISQQLPIRNGDAQLHKNTPFRLRAPELYGVGHFTQNRTRGYIHRLQGFKLVGERTASKDGQGEHC